MIINQDTNVTVPEKTIAIFSLVGDKDLQNKVLDFSSFLKPLNTNHKRDWFAPNFYHCLPLSIGNMQGFVFSVPYTFDIVWNGGNLVEDISINIHEDINLTKNPIYVSSEFGNGIITIHYPITLKTPQGVNLMTIAPPNFPMPGISPMTGVIETDNIRFTFTLNLKIDIPNIPIRILKDTPVIGIIPIPRYFCDSFSLKNANEIFDKNVIEDEIKTINKHTEIRNLANINRTGPDRIYYKGMDVYYNKFKDHQLPKRLDY
jgi:hypothetical protein